MTATADTLKLVAPDSESSTAVAAAPVLITVQEVALGTAAAMPVLPTTRRRWAGAPSVVLASIRKMFLASTGPQPPDARAPRGSYPKRYSYLEYATMSREMDRL
jgi:hypothetical protein